MINGDFLFYQMHRFQQACIKQSLIDLDNDELTNSKSDMMFKNYFMQALMLIADGKIKDPVDFCKNILGSYK